MSDGVPRWFCITWHVFAVPNTSSGPTFSAVVAGEMSHSGAARNAHLENKKGTGGLTTSKKGDAAQVKKSGSPHKAAQGEGHPDLQYLDGTREAAVPVMLLHALLRPAGCQPPPSAGQSAVAAADATHAYWDWFSRADVVLAFRELMWYWLAGAACTNETADAGEEAAEQAIKMEADMRVEGNSRWDLGS